MLKSEGDSFKNTNIHIREGGNKAFFGISIAD